jgi:hypothetical protein
LRLLALGKEGLQVVPANHVPTLSEWATILLAGLMVLFGWGRLRRAGRLRA